MARYGLASHVFVCRNEEYIVVLDVRQDNYFTLEAAKTAALRVAVPGWPASAPADGAPAAAVAEIAAPLLQRGWLLEEALQPGGPRESKEATPVRIPAPEAELTEGGGPGSLQGPAGSRVKIGPGIVFSFVAASLFAKFAQRFWSLERVINRVARRKATRGASERFDLERARQLVAAFLRLRVFLFSTRDECLHDSLAVVEFLARYGLYPNWVFGVRARPFEAHCWIQHGGVVFNDSVDEVGSFVPIMVV